MLTSGLGKGVSMKGVFSLEESLKSLQNGRILVYFRQSGGSLESLNARESLEPGLFWKDPFSKWPLFLTPITSPKGRFSGQIFASRKLTIRSYSSRIARIEVATPIWVRNSFTLDVFIKLNIWGLTKNENRNWGTFGCSWNESRNEGPFARSPGTKTGTRVHSPKPQTALLSSLVQVPTQVLVLYP